MYRYLVQEYVNGGELFEYISHKGALPEHEAIRLFRQVIRALAYCHRLNVYHRDVKPENIMLDSTSFTVKLADFGMATLQLSANKWLNTSCGSPHYAAPEVVSGRKYSGDKADIWSCGVILFALLAGYLPFEGGDVQSTLRLVKKGEYRLPPRFLSDDALDLLGRILQRDPDDRIGMHEIWTHPLLKHAHIIDEGGPPFVGPADPISARECGPVLRRREDVDVDILRSLQILRHGLGAEEIVNRLMDRRWVSCGVCPIYTY